MMVEVGYVGTKGVALPDRRAINQAVLASATNPINGNTTNTSANTQLRVPYTGLSPAGLLAEETAADSRYNSLQASVTRRTSRGLRLQASYTYSKSMDDTSGGSTTLFSEISGDESNMGSSKGVSDFDRTHRLMINSSYEIPRWGFGCNNTAIGKRFFSGWQISGIGIWQSGAPFSITDSAGAVFYGTTGSPANYAAGATAQSAQKSGSPQSPLKAYFDTAAVARAGNLFGNVGRNTMRGPRPRHWGLSPHQ